MPAQGWIELIYIIPGAIISFVITLFYIFRFITPAKEVSGIVRRKYISLQRYIGLSNCFEPFAFISHSVGSGRKGVRQGECLYTGIGQFSKTRCKYFNAPAQ